MPAKSEKQQKFMGIVHGLQKGTVDPSKVSKKAKEVAKDIKPSAAKAFASTKHKGLPVKVKKLKEDSKPENRIGECWAVMHPHRGATVAGMLREFDPVHGLSHAGMEPHQVHSIHANKDEAQKLAEELHSSHTKKMEELEEKKDEVAKKITAKIDELEKKRQEHVKMAKEDPTNAGKHKDHIAKFADQISDLMDKLEKVEKSKKPVKKEEEKED